MALFDRVLEEELGREPATGRVPRPARKPSRGPKYGRETIRGVALFDGVEELQAALDGFLPKFQKKAVRHGSRKAAHIVKEDAKKRAPEGDPDDPHYDHRRPGQLKRGIKVRALPRSRTTTGAQVVIGDESGLFSGQQFYAGFQELGWMHTGRGKRTGSSGRHIPGLGFLRKALYDNKDKVFGAYVLETRKKLNGIARELLKESGGYDVIRGGFR